MTGIATTERWLSRRARWANAYNARVSGLARAPAGFRVEPELRSVGSHARGRQIMDGTLLLSGRLVHAAGMSIWDVDPPDEVFRDERQGCGWLDDLAAAGHPEARERAQEWVWDWIARYGAGAGDGWTPELAARRLVRWINHAQFLLQGQDARAERTFLRALARHTVYLTRSWQLALPGMARFEVLTALIVAGCSLDGMAERAAQAIEALSAECDRSIDAAGGIATRNPEELMEVLTLLNWAVAALKEAGQEPPRRVAAAIGRIVPTLRALRHADGGLARFHGGGRGAEGRLEMALVNAGVRTPPGHAPAMGYARLTSGRTTLIADAAPPPAGVAALGAHASALAFELTSGRRPLIVNCGSGATFGSDWYRAGRATPSHSALCIDGVSSARLGARRVYGGLSGEPLVDGPSEVWAERGEGEGEHRLSMSHDAWTASYGLACFRELALTSDGRALGGEDTLVAMSDEERVTFDFALERGKLPGIPFSIRFHLHPDAEAEHDEQTNVVSISLRSGEVWMFRHDGMAELSLEPSVYLERGRRRPRATQQIVLSATVINYAGRVSWTLAKAVDTPSNLRDLEMAEPALDETEL
jgi:uncharacterized heparinase superfamily protein